MPLSDRQAECRNIEGTRTKSCASWSRACGLRRVQQAGRVLKMREALFSQAQAAQARQLDSLGLVMDGL